MLLLFGIASGYNDTKRFVDDFIYGVLTMPGFPLSCKVPFLVANVPFQIEQRAILRELRIPKAKSFGELNDPKLEAELGRAVDIACTLIAGKGVYRTFPIEAKDQGRVRVLGLEDALESRSLAKVLEHAEFVSVLVATIGPSLDKKVEELTQAEPTLAYLLDRIGGWMADYMAGKIDERIEAEAKRAGFGRTMRYSPGYGDFSLSYQPLLLEKVEGWRVGVALTEGFMLVPQKSVTALIGWEVAHA